MAAVGRLVAAGRTSDLFEYGRGTVVKLPRAGVPGHWAAMEAEFTAAVHAMGLPTPEVAGVVELGGRPATVFEYIDGESMWERMRSSPAEIRPLTVELAAVHRKILCADLPEGLLSAARRARNKIDEAAALGAAGRLDAAREAEALPSGAALLHGDLHPANVLMSARGPVVIDWFDAAIGHPVADIVRSAFLIRPAGAPHHREHLPGATAEMLVDLHRCYLEEMFDLLRHDLDSLGRWERMVAASRLSEGAEPEAPVVELWHALGAGHRSDLERVVSAIDGDETSQGRSDAR